MHTHRRPLFALSALFIAYGTACGGAAPAPKANDTKPLGSFGNESGTVTTGAPLGSVDESAIDRSVSACDDFYTHACGAWLKSNPIPDDEVSWGRSFSTILEKNESLLHEILERYARGEGLEEPYAKALGSFYGACMDERQIEEEGASGLKPEMQIIESVKDPKSLTIALADLHARGFNPLFSTSSMQDFKDATKVILAVEQAGLGMPDRDYYLEQDAKRVALRKDYATYITNVFTLLGEKQKGAEEAAKTVLRIETALAKASMSKVDRRDPKKVYHLTPISELAKNVPGVQWDQYFPKVGAGSPTQLNVAQPDFFKAIGELLKGPFNATEWKTYLKWSVLRRAAGALPQKFVDEDFKWKSALSGIAKLPPRWKRCVRITDTAMGEALAQPFVKQTLGAEGKLRTKQIILSIEEAMKENIGSLPWMDAETKAQAVMKLAKINNKVAYPDTWRNYDALVVTRESYLRNRISADQFEFARDLKKIGKPVDRNEWFMSPPTVNAYYEPSLNEMVFPAGILQPPFYSNTLTLPTNYGAIGMVMGHEATHGFDDEGRQFDKDGNLKDWWTARSSAEFDKRAECVTKQFDDYLVLGDQHVNGKLTLGENIADLGGVKLAFKAMLKEVAKHPLAPSKYTPQAQFFYGFAQGWCTNMRDEMMRQLVLTNPHSPPSLRVNGPLSNLPEFAEAFQCKAGSEMVRANRCEVW